MLIVDISFFEFMVCFYLEENLNVVVDYIVVSLIDVMEVIYEK